MKQLHVLVFGSGAILMALEVLGSRLMAPHFGNSVYVWGSLISVFLMALSAGYYLGGILADAKPRPETLTLVLAAAGAFTSFIPAAAEPVARTFSEWGPRAGALAAATVIFLPPTILMGMVSPLAIRLGVANLARLGQTSGRLYAVSTAGSIAGTLVTTFFLVPLAGTKLLITGLAAGLFVLTAISLLTERKRAWAIAAAGFGIFLILWGPTGALTGRLALGPGFGVLQTVFATESAYHNIRVMDGNGVRYPRFNLPHCTYPETVPDRCEEIIKLLEEDRPVKRIIPVVLSVLAVVAALSGWWAIVGKEPAGTPARPAGGYLEWSVSDLKQQMGNKDF